MPHRFPDLQNEFGKPYAVIETQESMVDNGVVLLSAGKTYINASIVIDGIEEKCLPTATVTSEGTTITFGPEMNGKTVKITFAS